MYDNNIIANKSKKFAVRVVKLGKYLREEQKEYVLSKQIVRSGTSIGANVREALQAQTRKEFASKMNIALKEASETEYWLEILFESEMLTNEQFQSMKTDCSELNKILISIVKNTKL
ncbi:MAG: four helix bundle protein [Oscillospiraceae bacterium]|nr:four helix bundle protein [Oscillospiraceae bacterium]MBQ8884329.1 four helix bundle protein [Oscillospiraceae bacterium]